VGGGDSSEQEQRACVRVYTGGWVRAHTRMYVRVCVCECVRV